MEHLKRVLNVSDVVNQKHPHSTVYNANVLCVWSVLNSYMKKASSCSMSDCPHNPNDYFQSSRNKN